MSQKQAQKDFLKGIQKLTATAEKMAEIANQVKIDLAEITNTAKSLYIITQDDITPLVSDDSATPATSPTPAAKPRSRRKKIDLDAAPESEETNDEATETTEETGETDSPAVEDTDAA